MNKKLLSLLLVLILVISVTVITSFAEETTPAHTNHCVCGGGCDDRGDHKCADSGVIENWTPFSEEVLEYDEDTKTYSLPSGNYYLTGKTVITGKSMTIMPDAKVTFCLNGYQMTTSSRTFRVNGELNITDCQPTRDGKTTSGKIIGNSGSAPVIYVYSGGHVNLYRGTLTGKAGVTRNFGAVIALGKDPNLADAEGRSSMTMYGGTIDASQLTLVKKDNGDNGGGGAIIVMGSAANPATFIQYGGTIKGAKSVEANGAAIYCTAGNNLQILGGVVKSGKAAQYGDGIYAVKGANVVVGGTATIEDVYIPGDGIINVEKLTGSVGITRAHNTYSVFANCDTADSAAHLTSNVDGRSLVVTEAEGKFQVALSNVHADHCVCGGNLTGAAAENHTCPETAPTWTALTAENIVRDAGITVASDRETDSKYNMFAQSGCYYLTENITLERVFEIRPSQDITICLNGYTLTLDMTDANKDNRQSIFRMTGGKLSICDCTGKGTVKSTWTGTASIAYLLNGYADATEGVTFNLYGGNLTATGKSTANNAGVAQIGNSSATTPATMNIYGGTITGTQRVNGGAINMINSTAATLNIYGGTIQGGKVITKTATDGKVSGGSGGNITCIYGTINIHGGTITGGAAANYGGNIYMSGAKATLNVYGGKIINGSAGTRGGNIYVNGGSTTIFGGTITGGELTNHERGLDIGLAANDNTTLTLDGKVNIGEIGVHGHKYDVYALHLTENFSTEKVIQIQSTNSNKIIVGATKAHLASFAPTNENAQLVLNGTAIYMGIAGVHNACICGGTYVNDGSSINHECAVRTDWVPVNAEFIANSATTTEEVAGTDAEGNPTTETVTTITGWGTPVYYDHKSLNGTYYEIPTGYYYLTEDITLEHGMRVVRGASVWIDLNGHTITSPADNARAIFLQGSLRICDSSYDATKENKAEQFQGGIIMARSVNYGMAYVSGADKKDGAVGELRIFGGKYSATADTSKLTASMIGAIGKVYIFDGYYEAAPMNGNGALIVLQGATHADGYLAIRKATLVGAEAKNGGLISATDEGTLVAIRSGNLIGAEVSGRGGAIYMTNGELEIYGGTISGGTAKAEGGNIYTSNLKMTGGTVADGVSASYGGNIYLTGNAEISGGQIKDGLSTSTSRSGGNICVANKSTLIIKGNAEIFGGKANEGGNISVRDGSTVNIEGGKIYNGEAVKHGGNIVAFTTLNISGGEIYGGKAVDRGGNISTYGNYGKITITGGHIYNGILAGEYEKTVNGELTIYNPEANARYGANISMLSIENKPLELTILGGEIGGLGEGSLDVSSVHIQSSGDEITTTVGGTAVIDSLRMGTGRMLTIHEDGFAEGASIGIERFEIAGLFAPDASADVAQYFHATEDGIEVRADETGLILFALKPYWAFDVNNKQVAGAATIAEAMAIEGASFVRLVQDATTDEVITGDLYLDLYGHDLTGLTVNGKANIVDYATNKYADDVAGNLINFTGDVQKLYKADGEKFSVTTTYLALQAEDGSWSFHCVALSISHISLDAKNDALGFKATVSGDSAVQAAVNGFGFNMGVEGGTMRTFTMEGNHGDDGMFTLRLKGIMAANGGEMPIIGEAFILFDDEALTSSQKTTSMKEAIEAVNAAWDSYTDEQKAAVKAFVEANIAKMEGWAITNIQAWAPATEEPTPAE